MWISVNIHCGILGQERFRTITSSYYRGAHGIFIVYDVTDVDSFDNIKQWIGEVQKYATADAQLFLIANKTDLESHRAINTETGQNLADKYGIPFIETSAKNASNVDKAFQMLASNVKSAMIHEHSVQFNGQHPIVGPGQSLIESGKCCAII